MWCEEHPTESRPKSPRPTGLLPSGEDGGSGRLLCALMAAPFASPISLTGGSANKSTHGKFLLRELSNGYKHADLQECINFVNADANAARLKSSDEYKNTSFHLLLGSDFPPTFVLPLLKLMVLRSKEGVLVRNAKGYLPLHLCMTQATIIVEAAFVLLDAYPETAGSSVPDIAPLPLFLAVMRDNASFELCKRLCQLHPDGPSTQNKTKSLPLHFACKRVSPNLDVLRMLLKRHPQGAAHVNGFGLLPIHCLVSVSDSLQALIMLYDAYPEGVKTQDRLGKTCLHLAASCVGRDHSSSAARDLEDDITSRRAERLEVTESGGVRLKDSGDAPSSADVGIEDAKSSGDDDTYGDDECEDLEEAEINSARSKSSRPAFQEYAFGRGRRVMRFLVSKYPEALATNNNFGLIPVDCLLEKVKPIKTKKKIVYVYGLYDDPPSARLLLTSYKHYLNRGVIRMPMKLFHMVHLHELNWLSRKDALLVSMVGNSAPSKKPKAAGAKVSRGGAGGSKSKAAAVRELERSMGGLGISVKDIDSSNILARLRRVGELDCLRIICSFL